MTTGLLLLRLLRRARGRRARRASPWPPAYCAAWSRSQIVLSLRSVTSSGCTGAVSLLPTDGSSISPGLISGAVTMKITSSTSITSMYGTTLIWLMALRGRRMLS